MVALVQKPIHASSLSSVQQVSSKVFFDAVGRGDLKRIMEFVQGGGDINIANASILGFSALFLTISHGPIGQMEPKRLAIFDYLINQKELRINSVHPTMGNALNYAVRFKREELIQPLIDSGIVIDHRVGNVSPLLQACDCGYLDIARILLANGANPNIRFGPSIRSSFSCMGVAIQKKNFPLLELILSSTSLDVNQQYAFQRSSSGQYHLSNALHQAFENDFIDAIAELIAAGAIFDPNLTYHGFEEITSSLYQQEFPLKGEKPNKYIDAVNEGFALKKKRVSSLIDYRKVLKKAPVEERDRDKRTHELVQEIFDGNRGVVGLICSY